MHAKWGSQPDSQSTSPLAPFDAIARGEKKQLPIGVHRHRHTEDSSQRHESTHTHTMADNNKSIWVIRIKELREFGELGSAVEKHRETTKKRRRHRFADSAAQCSVRLGTATLAPLKRTFPALSL